jgi:hypothetical protein
MSEKIKKQRWQEFKVAFFYDENHTTLSRTAIMNVIFFICAIATLIIGIVAKMVMNIELPATIYGYIGGLCGGGFLQYSYSKVLNIKKQQITTQQPGVQNEE